jgi:tRNA (mo5U34)-methyltransferase
MNYNSFNKICDDLDIPKDIKNKSLFFFNPKNHGNFILWQETIDNIPKITKKKVYLKNNIPSVCFEKDLLNKHKLENIFEKFKPWRKGPFLINNLLINAEWNASLKFERLIKKLPTMKNDVILDVGSNNGYYLLRFATLNAKYAIGCEPMMLFNMQFKLLQKFFAIRNICTLPLKLEQINKSWQVFDKIFAMGVLYHNKNPINFLEHTKKLLKQEGMLILETLILEDNKRAVLTPKNRYAKMRNVWFIPSIETLKIWLDRVGFKTIETISIKRTNTQEQRTTKWCEFESLKDFLSPDDNNKTIEGYPAPVRAILLCQK